MSNFIKYINFLYKRHYDFINFLGNKKINLTLCLCINLIIKLLWLKLYYLLKFVVFIYFLFIKKRYFHLILIIIYVLLIKFVTIYLNFLFLNILFIIFLIKIYVIDYLLIEKKQYVKHIFKNFLINYIRFIDNKIKQVYQFIIKRIKK